MPPLTRADVAPEKLYATLNLPSEHDCGANYPETPDSSIILCVPEIPVPEDGLIPLVGTDPLA